MAADDTRYPALLDPAGIDQLRAALTAACHTSTGIAERLGPPATSGLARNDFRAALRLTEDRDALGTLATHAETVTATDLSIRALRFAATTAALNGQRWELRHGDLVTPVARRRFDLVVSNPPFVVGSGTTTHSYRDSGRIGDGVCAELAAAAPDLLTEGGIMQYLANWMHVA